MYFFLLLAFKLNPFSSMLYSSVTFLLNTIFDSFNVLRIIKKNMSVFVRGYMTAIARILLTQKCFFWIFIYFFRISFQFINDRNLPHNDKDFSTASILFWYSHKHADKKKILKLFRKTLSRNFFKNIMILITNQSEPKVFRSFSEYLVKSLEKH